MLRTIHLLTAVLVAALLLATSSAAAQAPSQGRMLPLRSGPGADFQITGEVPVDSTFFLTARNADGTWLLAETPDHAQEGWVPARYVTFSTVDVAALVRGWIGKI